MARPYTSYSMDLRKKKTTIIQKRQNRKHEKQQLHALCFNLIKKVK